jgi:hypothetical protein
LLNDDGHLLLVLVQIPHKMLELPFGFAAEKLGWQPKMVKQLAVKITGLQIGIGHIHESVFIRVQLVLQGTNAVDLPVPISPVTQPIDLVITMYCSRAMHSSVASSGADAGFQSLS